jgi:hypothetical protein
MELTTTSQAEMAAEAALDAARHALGVEVALAGVPEPAVGGFGPGAWLCQLTGDLPAPWDAPVLVRLASTAAVRRERDWHAHCLAHGGPVPPVLGVVEGDADAAPGAIVLARGPALSLIEALGESPLHIPQLLRGMAEMHARVHGLPVAGAPPALAATPLDTLDAALAAAGLRERFAAEREWLGTHRPPPSRLAVCHGDVQPASLRLDLDDVESGRFVNWSQARVGDVADDLALTLLMFWSAPYLAEGIGQRKMLKTVRDMITDGYRAAYEEAPGSAPVPDENLRYWGAFHALAWSVRLAAAEAAGGPADVWDPVGLVQHVASYRKDLARRFARLARG